MAVHGRSAFGCVLTCAGGVLAFIGVGILGSYLAAVPLMRQAGVWPTTWVPAGVAVYDGRSGFLTIRPDVAAGELPGPVYPSALADAVRSSTPALPGDFVAWFFKLAGWEDTESDKDDPNGPNRADFHLLRTDKTGSDHVTPLTVNGTATGISAVQVTGASSVQAGVLNPTVIHRFPVGQQRPSNSATVTAIKSNFGTDVPWQTGATIFEITPISQDEWVASIGLNQSISYRVLIKADQSMCLTDGAGKAIRCTGEPATATPAPTTGRPVSELSDAELIALAQQILDEQKKRLPKR